MDLEKFNRWIHSSKNFNHTSERIHNEKANIDFHRESTITEDLCYIGGKLGHY